MNTPSPASVRTAHLAQVVREARKPAYTTETPKREHLMAVEFEATDGYRYWSGDMPESMVNAYIEQAMSLSSDGLSDVDHAGNCWCGGRDEVF